MKKISALLLTIAISGIITLSSILPTLAVTPNLTNASTEVNTTATAIGYNITGTNDITIVVGNLIKTVLVYLGIIFLILVIISGIQWMTAQGNDDAVKKSKARIINATIGLAITLGAYAITYFVITLIGLKTMTT